MQIRTLILPQVSESLCDLGQVLAILLAGFLFFVFSCVCPLPVKKGLISQNVNVSNER